MNAGLRWATGLPAIETTGRGAQFSLAGFTAGTRSIVYPTAPPGVYFYGDPGDSARLLPRQMEPA